jgi:hypothetical protein
LHSSLSDSESDYSEASECDDEEEEAKGVRRMGKGEREGEETKRRSLLVNLAQIATVQKGASCVELNVMVVGGGGRV